MIVLTPAERNSAVWRKLLEHLKTKLEETRGKNDGQHDAVTTATLRGQIGAFKALIALDKDPQ